MDKLLSSLKNLILALSAIILVAMMLLTALDVGLRYLANSPFPGGLEIVEFMMALIIPFSLVVTAYDKAHIEVDLLVERLSERIKETIGCLTELISTLFYAVITWQSFFYIGEQYRSHLTSAVLLIPHHPFVISLTIAFAILTLLSLVFFLKRISFLISKWTP